MIGGVDHCQVDGWCYTIVDACNDEEIDEDYPFGVLGNEVDNLVKSNMACDAIQDGKFMQSQRMFYLDSIR